MSYPAPILERYELSDEGYWIRIEDIPIPVPEWKEEIRLQLKGTRAYEVLPYPCSTGYWYRVPASHSIWIVKKQPDGTFVNVKHMWMEKNAGVRIYLDSHYHIRVDWGTEPFCRDFS